MNYRKAKKKFIRKRVYKFVVKFTESEFVSVSRDRTSYRVFHHNEDRLRSKFLKQLRNKFFFENQFLFAKRKCTDYGWSMYYFKMKEDGEKKTVKISPWPNYLR